MYDLTKNIRLVRAAYVLNITMILYIESHMKELSSVNGHGSRVVSEETLVICISFSIWMIMKVFFVAIQNG